MDTRIFVSYASEDQVPARAIVAFLKAAGFDTWFDKDSLLAGQDWGKVVEQEIARARLLILCLSRNSVEKTGFVQKEMNLALQQAELRPSSQVYIMPVKLDDCGIPEPIARWQCLDLRGEKASVKLLEAIQSATGDGARAPNSEHRALTDAIAHYNQGPSEKDITTPSLSDAAQELRQLIEKETNLEDRGIVHILTEIEPGMTMFFPRIQYSGSPLRMKSRLFRQAIEELVAGGFLCPPEVNPSTNTQTFECRTKN
jgi:hypothetical protein